MIKNVKAPTGDFRDWDAISAWAMGIAAAVKGEGRQRSSRQRSPTAAVEDAEQA